jgi:alcohol dehydrogenase class IV
MYEENFDYNMPVKVHFGAGRINTIGRAVSDIGKRALVVTGKSSMKKLGITDRVISLLCDASVEAALFDQVLPNPADEIVDRGAEVAKEHNADVIIGLGGGSAMDVAKGIAVVAALGGRLWDYIGEDKFERSVVPIVAIPTTAGTGSETTPYAVFTKPDIHRKDAVVSPLIYPRVAVLDPLLMKSMTPELTIDTGVDALSHAVEAYMSTMANPFSDSFSLESIKLIFQYIEKAAYDGEDLSARSKMALASALAGMAIAHAGVVAGHGIGMAIGGLLNTSHGRTVGILLPHVMKYNVSAIPGKIAALAHIVGVGPSGDDVKDAESVVERFFNVMNRLKFPTSLGAVGVSPDNLSDIVEDSMSQEDLGLNPRKFDRAAVSDFLASIQ